MKSKQDKFILKIILKKAITKKTPTPIETAPIVTAEGIALICVANIFKSGYAIVIIVPKIKRVIIIYIMFLLLATCAPIRSPIADIAISAPKVNNVIPNINKIVPMKKIAIESAGIGTNMNDNNKTINAIGKTDVKDSLSFACIFSFTLISPYLQV